MSASVSTATARDTQRMLEALDEAPGGFLLSPDWAPSTQLDFALALADRPCGAKLRILLGVENDPAQGLFAVGLDDAGATADKVVELAKRVGRAGTVEAAVHWLDAGWLVEVTADLA